MLSIFSFPRVPRLILEKQEQCFQLWDDDLMGKRDEARQRTTAAIMAAARREIAEHGAGGLSMRAIAREVGMVSSAVYRYFPTREALLTAMIIESYGSLAQALSQVSARTPARSWTRLATALREWARSTPHEFQLIYGTPVPGYQAPPETVPAAAAVATPFLRIGEYASVEGFRSRRLTAQMGTVADLVPGLQRSVAAAVLAELAALVGVVSLELSGHLVGSADPADHLYDALVQRQVATLGLTG